MKKKRVGKPAAKAGKAPAQPDATTEGLFHRVVDILEQARSSVARAVNSRMVVAYWLIGREIVQELQAGEERAEYGAAMIRNLSRLLTQRYGQGFSTTNLKYFRTFYSTYADRISEIGHTVCDQSGSKPSLTPEKVSVSMGHAECDSFTPAFDPGLSWSHYRAIMQVEKPDAREFYEKEAAAAGWNVRELQRQINSFYYERLLASHDKKGMLETQRKKPGSDLTKVFKSSAVLEFLGLPDSPRLHESDLERAIIENLQTFLLEMGRGFAFVARQRQIRFDDEEFFVDLVFYNYLLKCFVLIDLKIGKLTHQDIGQMDSYVRLYEDRFKVEGDNPTIGLILCSQKNETVARYSVLKENKQLFARKYRLHLPSEEELAAELKREIELLEEKKK